MQSQRRPKQTPARYRQEKARHASRRLRIQQTCPSDHWAPLQRSDEQTRSESLEQTDKCRFCSLVEPGILVGRSRGPAIATSSGHTSDVFILGKLHRTLAKARKAVVTVGRHLEIDQIFCAALEVTGPSAAISPRVPPGVDDL